MTKTCFADSAGIIYIRADGSIDPPSAPIFTLDNITYTLTGDIFNNSIVIEKSNIVLDGASHTIEGTEVFGYAINDYAITLLGSSNVTAKNTTIRAFPHGIELSNSSNNTLAGNNITTSIGGVGYAISLSDSSNNIIYGNILTNNGGGGITLSGSLNNDISRNNITNNWLGIAVLSSDSNIISGNDLTNNSRGISLDSSSNNVIFHNNFMNNVTQADSISPINVSSANTWDNGLEGNFWSGYNGTDSNQDGIGDTPYVIDQNNTDHYPLMGTFQSFNVSVTPQVSEEVLVISNSNIENVEVPTYSNQSPWGLILRVSGQNKTDRFCRVTFQNDLHNFSVYHIYIMGWRAVEASWSIIESNGTHTTLYITYNETTLPTSIVIIPEFSPFLILPLFMVATLLAIILYKRRHLTRASEEP